MFLFLYFLCLEAFYLSPSPLSNYKVQVSCGIIDVTNEMELQ